MEEEYKYVARLPNGSYYWWAGECGSSKHETNSLAWANKFDTPADVTWIDEDATPVRVRITYEITGEDAEANRQSA